MDVLLVLFELLSLDVRAESLRPKIDFEGTGLVCPKISGTRGHPLPTIGLVRKLDELFFHEVYEYGH